MAANVAFLLNRKHGGRGWDYLVRYFLEAASAWGLTTGGTVSPVVLGGRRAGSPAFPKETMDAADSGVSLKANIDYLVGQGRGGRQWDYQATRLLEAIVAFTGDLAP